MTDVPEFKVGRMIIAGDGSPEFRFLYHDNAIAERTVFELDNKGIAASVKPSVGSHFEGFLAGDSEPLFRLNSAPKMQLELGQGGSTATDVGIRRDSAGTLQVVRGDLSYSGTATETARFDNNGNVSIGTTDNKARMHIAAGSDQLMIEDSDGATDAKRWLIKADGGNFELLTANDSWTSWASALQINRSGVTVNQVVFPNGNVGIGTSSPNSTLQVNGYVQLGLTSGAPPSGDCDDASEEGRMKFDPASDLLYICSGLSGWVSK